MREIIFSHLKAVLKHIKLEVVYEEPFGLRCSKFLDYRNWKVYFLNFSLKYLLSERHACSTLNPSKFLDKRVKFFVLTTTFNQYYYGCYDI